jgi:thiamine biosynthesis lipoprotein
MYPHRRSPPLMAAELRFKAMGTDAHVVLVGARKGALDWARSEIERLELLWSRFMPDSEVSRINAAAGWPVRVSQETLTLIELAVEGWAATAGLFDPTVLRSLEALGYDRSFEAIPQSRPLRTVEPSPGCGDLVLDRGSMEVTLPSGVGFDPGGIGKGYAADIVSTRSIDEGHARGACINLGGDLRVAGEGPSDGPWMIDVDDPLGGRALARVPIQAGAIATTSSMRRTWQRDGVELHHVIDPRTGGSARTGLAAVTVVTGDAWWAEVLAKAAFLAGLDEAISMLRSLNAPAMLVEPHGFVHPVAGMEAWI